MDHRSPRQFIFLLSLTASGKNEGVDGKPGAFFRQARRSGLWPEAQAVHRSTVTKARAKLPWTAFEQMHHDAVRLAYEVWPTTDEHTWQGLSVFAIDDSVSPPRRHTKWFIRWCIPTLNPHLRPAPQSMYLFF